MNKCMGDEDIRFRLLKHLSEPVNHFTQRDLAGHLGISLGKTHYCLRELIKKGCIKATRFKNSRNKAAYAYILTPRGIEEKLNLTVQFLRRKENEYRLLELEIAQLHQELHLHHSVESLDII